MEFILILVWLLFCFLVASYSKSKSLGYWGGFFLSLILSPLIGFIIAVISSNSAPPYSQRFNRRMKEVEKEEFKSNKQAALDNALDLAFRLNEDISRAKDKKRYEPYKTKVIEKIKELGGEIPKQWQE